MSGVLSRRELSERRREIVDSQKWYWFESIGWHPHRYQVAAHRSLARERYTTAGRRGGKSEWAGHEASAYMVSGPYDICLVGPTYDDVSNEFSVIVRDLRHDACPHEIDRLVENSSAGNLLIRLSNGSSCIGKSAANVLKSPIIGKEYDLMILCEGAQIRNMGGDHGLWETQLRGNLMSRLGDLIVPTTPIGQDGWLYPRFLDGLSGKNPRRWSLQWPAWANPSYLEDPIELRREMSWRAFQEQVLGLFVSWGGSIWVEDCGFDVNRHIVDVFDVPNWWNRHEVIDPGFSGDFAWIAVVVDPSGVRYIVDEFSRKRTRYRDLASEILNRRDIMYSGSIPDNIPVYIDPEDPRACLEIAEAAGELGGEILTLPADNNVMSGFERGSQRFRSDRLFIFRSCSGVIDALLYHEWGGVTARGKQEKRDEWKHYSDIVRYSQLAPLHPSIRPEPVGSGSWTFRDLYSGVSGGIASGFGMPFSQWRMMHGSGHTRGLRLPRV